MEFSTALFSDFPFFSIVAYMPMEEIIWLLLGIGPSIFQGLTVRTLKNLMLLKKKKQNIRRYKEAIQLLLGLSAVSWDIIFSNRGEFKGRESTMERSDSCGLDPLTRPKFPEWLRIHCSRWRFKCGSVPFKQQTDTWEDIDRITK